MRRMIKETEISKLDAINTNDLAKLDSISEEDIQRLNNLTDADVARLNNLTDADVARLNNLTDADVARLNNLTDEDVARLNSLTDADVNKIQSITNDDIQSVKAMESPKNAAAGTVLTADGAGKAVYQAIQSGGGSEGAITIKDETDVEKYQDKPNVYRFLDVSSSGKVVTSLIVIGTIKHSRSVGALYYVSYTGVGLYKGLYRDPELSHGTDVSAGYYNTKNKAWSILSYSAGLYATDNHVHVITIEDSTGNVLYTSMMRSKVDLECNTYNNMHSTFGGRIFVGSGPYVKLDMRGGTLETDKLIRLDKTEVTLASLGELTFSDTAYIG